MEDHDNEEIHDVEVVGWRDPSLKWATISAENKAAHLFGESWQAASVRTFTEPLMTVAQHQRMLSSVIAERDGLKAARMAYASEFALDENGEPDIGSVHVNIRKLKVEVGALRNASQLAASDLCKASDWICREVDAGTTSATFWSIRLNENAALLRAAMAEKEE